VKVLVISKGWLKDEAGAEIDKTKGGKELVRIW